MRRVAPRVEERLAIHVGDRRDAREVLVVAVPLAGERDVDGVVNVVRPLRVEPVAALLRRTDQPRIIQVALRHELHLAAEPAPELVHLVGQLLEKGERAEVEDALHRVEPQRVDVELRDPVQRVVVRPAAHRVAARARRSSPRVPTACGTPR